MPFSNNEDDLRQMGTTAEGRRVTQSNGKVGSAVGQEGPAESPEGLRAP